MKPLPLDERDQPAAELKAEQQTPEQSQVDEASPEAGAEGGAGDLCGMKKGVCSDTGCKAAGGLSCKVYGGACVCVRSTARCKLSNSACGDNGCEDLGGAKCEFVGGDPDCVCIKQKPSTTPSGTSTFTLENGEVFLVYMDGAGTCPDMGASFEEPGKITVSGSTITIVTPGRELVGQIDPDGSFFASNADHVYVGKITPKGEGKAEVTYSGPNACTTTYAIAISPLG